MARIAKADIFRTLDQIGEIIKDAGGADGRISRDDMKNTLRGLDGQQKELVDVFYRFIGHRDRRAGAQITARDVDRAVTFAKEELVADYDLNNNGLSNDEIAKMSKTGELAVDLAKQLKQAAANRPQAMQNDPYVRMEQMDERSDFDLTVMYERKGSMDDLLHDAPLRAQDERVLGKVVDRIGAEPSPNGDYETGEPAIWQLKVIKDARGKVLGFECEMARRIEMGDDSEYDFDREHRAMVLDTKGEAIWDSGWKVNTPFSIWSTGIGPAPKFGRD